MFNSEIDPFILSLRKTRVRFSLLSPMPWSLTEYPHMNSTRSEETWYAFTIEALANGIADKNGYTGVEREDYVAQIIAAGHKSRAEWFPETPEGGPPVPPPPSPPPFLIADELFDTQGGFWLRSQPEPQSKAFYFFLGLSAVSLAFAVGYFIKSLL